MSRTPMIALDGERLRELRLEHLMLINDLAEATGLHRNMISDYEHGKSGAMPQTVKKLAEALDVSPQELMAPDGASTRAGREAS